MSYNIAPIIDFNLLLSQTTECSFFLKNNIQKNHFESSSYMRWKAGTKLVNLILFPIYHTQILHSSNYPFKVTIEFKHELSEKLKI